MSRVVDQAVLVSLNNRGVPTAIVIPRPDGGVAQTLLVYRSFGHQRRYVDAIQGEPERDIWQVEVEGGRIGELHRLRDPGGSTESWVLYRWQD